MKGIDLTTFLFLVLKTKALSPCNSKEKRDAANCLAESVQRRSAETTDLDKVDIAGFSIVELDEGGGGGGWVLGIFDRHSLHLDTLGRDAALQAADDEDIFPCEERSERGLEHVRWG